MTTQLKDHGPFRFTLLGGAALEGPRPNAHLEKRTAALVAYLAVEGVTSRSRVAGLLWPDSKESTARNNLAQATRRLRTAAGVQLVSGEESLELAAPTDVGEMLVAVHEGRFADAAFLAKGELLEGYDFDDRPELEAWLRGARGHIGRAAARAVAFEIERAESEGRIDEALVLAERAVAAEPLSESAHLRVTRLLLSKGDAPAAMNAYERCRKVLAKELAMKPSPAMLDVLRAIREGKPPSPARRAAAPRALPASVLRPPWIGRAREWRSLEAALDAKKGAVVTGAAGVGKSRLLREFAERRGAFVVIEGRPGDADIPYATVARGVRAILKESEVALPEWARLELARVVPELAEESAVTSMRSKLRFLEALAHTVRLAVSGGLRVIAIDDVQWVDPSSVEALFWIAEQAWSGEIDAAVILAHRDEELSLATAERVERALSAGLAVTVDVGPLTPDEALDLVRALGIDAIGDRMATIAQASHGVPLFLLEIVRAALDPDRDEAGVTIPDRVKALIRKRLDKIDDAAMRLARVAAITGPAFDLDLAANVLGTSPLDLAAPWAALESAQILAGGRLAHDVLAEVVREDVPRVVREHVHARAATHLAARNADPALVAHHYEAGAREGDAAPFLIKAGLAARALSRVTEANSMFERAARAFENTGQRSAACDALYQLVRGHVGEEAERLADRLDRLAETPRDRCRAACFRAGVDVDAGRFQSAEDHARRAEDLGRAAGDTLAVAKAVQVRLDAAIQGGRLGAELDTMLASFDAATESLGDPEGLAAAALYHGEVELLRENPERALSHVSEAIGHMERWGQLLYGKARLLAARARVRTVLGDHDGAARDLDDATASLEHTAGAIGAQAHVRIARSELALALGDPPRAIDALGALPDGAGLPRDVRYAKVLRAEARERLGDHRAADMELDEIVQNVIADARLRTRAAVGRIRIAAASRTTPAPSLVELVEREGGAGQVSAMTKWVAGSSSSHPG